MPLLGQFIRRQSEGLTASTPEPWSAACDIALVTVIREEYEALHALLSRYGSLRPWESGSGEVNVFGWDVGALPTGRAGASYRLVVAMAGKAGNLNMKDVVSETAARFKPRFTLLLGIAGGLPRDGVHRGSLVISNLINGYEPGKLDEKGFHPRLGDTYPVDTALLTAALKLPAVAPRWHDDVLVSAPEGDAPPNVVDGPVASGKKVIDDASQPFFLQVMQQFPKLVAVEMEAAGGASAIHFLRMKQAAPCGFLALRGISDMPAQAAPDGAPTTVGEAQRQERDRWKRHAAAVAAAYAVNLIRYTWPVVPREQAG